MCPAPFFKNQVHGPTFCFTVFFSSDHLDVRQWKVVCSLECNILTDFSPAFLTRKQGEKFQKENEQPTTDDL